MDKKADVKVFVTKTKKFRARIKEPGQEPYQVTIMGEGWENYGKGNQHRAAIYRGIVSLMEALKKEQAAFSLCEKTE